MLFFDFIARVVDRATGGVENTLLFLFPWRLVGFSVALTWWRVGKGFALFTLLAALFIANSGNYNVSADVVSYAV